MSNVDDQIKVSNDAICKLIDKIDTEDRGFLSQNILDKLRTFVEAIAVKASGEVEYRYDIFDQKAKHFITTKANLQFLRKFHQFLQQTLSHYLPDEENSERLMLKYYEYLLRVKSFLKSEYGLNVLHNIYQFPITQDSALLEYYKKISEKINIQLIENSENKYNDRFYIKKVKPFFVNDSIYYEITFTTAIDNVSKFERVIAFSKFDILPNYAVKLKIRNEIIEVLGKKMPIQIIDEWQVSIRPCELDHFADIFGSHSKISAGSKEYYNLMQLMTRSGLNLVDVIRLSDEYYARFKKVALVGAQTSHFWGILDRCRDIVQRNLAGSNTLSYLLYSLNNKVIKLQSNNSPCEKLSNLFLQWGCLPFDNIPFNTSLIEHNPRRQDLINCVDYSNRKHELFANYIKNNTEQNGVLYTSRNDLTGFENVDDLIESYNKELYYKHVEKRKLCDYKGNVYICGYETDTLHIIEKLKELSKNGIKNYSNSIDNWLQSPENSVDCDEKVSILKQIFEDSHVAMVYGSAGTGKTTLINHISTFHKDFQKLYLANTNPAVENLNRRITAGNSKFQTITSFLSKRNEDVSFDLLFIDECSTVSNADMIAVLNKADYKLLVLVGDIYQIESILFGNWFGIAKSFLPKTSVFELTKPYRTNNTVLLELWDRVRNIKDNILEHITNNNLSTRLDSTIFERSDDDEIILCLNYDGLYGINNINRFLQESNPSETIRWGIHTYKIGDPILFNESNRFKPLIHNNLKGKIVNIVLEKEKIIFDIEIDKSINELDLFDLDLELLGESDTGKSIIRFSVDRLQSTDEDNDSSVNTVPFQIAYAVSVHKAQGLEYSSVKVVITDETEEMITHNIFYTAITRAKNKLKIFWTPETEKKILESLKHKFNKKDLSLLREKFKL